MNIIHPRFMLTMQPKTRKKITFTIWDNFNDSINQQEIIEIQQIENIEKTVKSWRNKVNRLNEKK